MKEVVSIENYEIRFSRSDYTHILEYLCKVFFLTTLNIYKDYFKGRHKVVAIIVIYIVWLETKIILVHLSLCRSYYFFTPGVLWPRSFLIFIVDELKNFAANIFLKLVCLSHTEIRASLISHVLRFMHWMMRLSP